MSDKMKLRIVGLCILAAFLLFGGGMTLLGRGYVNLGVNLALLNSVAVVTIGLLLSPIMTATGSAHGGTYQAARIIEGILLAISIFVAQSGQQLLGMSADNFYQIAMVALGLGSLPMCLWLIKSTRVSNWIGILGFVGYSCLILSMILAGFGFETASLALLPPGALFEIIFGGLLLLGFNLRSQI
jgi:hypothetical protein